MFKTIDIAFHPVHATYWRLTPVRLPDYTFTNLFAWSEGHRLSWREQANLLWLKRIDSENVFWAPLGDWENADWADILPSFAPGTVFERVPERLIAKLEALFPGRFAVEETPEEWDYLYEQPKLATLSGSKLHKKKNHWNAFIKTYGEDFRVLGPLDIPLVKAFEAAWYAAREDRDSPAITNENRAVMKALDHFEAIGGLALGGLFHEDRLIAFSLGEPLDERTFMVHFEKGMPEYRGVYQAINLAFAREFGKGYALINREQDSGSEGLRQAKRSYYPVAFGVKNRLRLL
jgi:hypothetical protein